MRLNSIRWRRSGNICGTAGSATSSCQITALSSTAFVGPGIPCAQNRVVWHHLPTSPGCPTPSVIHKLGIIVDDNRMSCLDPIHDLADEPFVLALVGDIDLRHARTLLS